MSERLAMFDLDGTLYDTVRANHAAYAAALAKHGFPLAFERFAAGCNGRHYKDFLPEIIGEENCTEELLEAVHKDKTALYAESLHLVAENAALFGILWALRHSGWKTALVTTASRENCHLLLAHFGRMDAFDAVITREDVAKGKPDPEGFLTAMRRLDAEPDTTVIFEDAEEGLAAARAATHNVYQTQTFIGSAACACTGGE